MHAHEESETSVHRRDFAENAPDFESEETEKDIHTTAVNGLQLGRNIVATSHAESVLMKLR